MSSESAGTMKSNTALRSMWRQEAESEPPPFMRSFDDARNVGHHEAPVSPVRDHAQVRLQGGEGVIGDLGFRRRHDTEQGRFARIGKAHQAHIGKQFQLENAPQFLAVFSGLEHSAAFGSSGI